MECGSPWWGDWRVIAYDREKWEEVFLAVKILDGS
jgi:hypothetical protein